ncbi:hypothetical protein ACJZRD_002173 [Enterococcus hirae]
MFIRFIAINERLRQKCSASRNKKEFPKIASQIFGKFRFISEDATFVSPFIRFLEILEETETTFVPVPLFLRKGINVIETKESFFLKIRKRDSFVSFLYDKIQLF